MADEFEVRAAEFVTALKQQRRMGLRGGIYHLTQMLMAYNSNRIEGSRLTEEQTRYLFETRTVVGDASVDDVIETTNHFRAFDLMIDHVGARITAETLKDYHRVLKSGTSDAEKEWFAVGDWKQLPNEVGGRSTTAPEVVDLAIEDLVARYVGPMTFDDVCRFHYEFESIHPFQDGNGRVGRMVLFEQCLANEIMPFVVLDESKSFYYRGLAEFEEQPGYLRDTFRSFQDAYYARFQAFVPRVG